MLHDKVGSPSDQFLHEVGDSTSLLCTCIIPKERTFIITTAMVNISFAKHFLHLVTNWRSLNCSLVDIVSPLKYFTVLTRSSNVASSSHTKTVCGCCWNADTVHMWFTPSSIALYKANALCAPVMRIMTWEETENVTCGLDDRARATWHWWVLVW